MESWSKRVVEEANLFNPAFCTALLAKAIEDYIKKTQQPFPFALAFLVLPVVLHRGTRDILPSSTVSSLLTWIQDNRVQLVNFPSRVRSMQRITKDTIIFGVQHETLAIVDSGGIVIGPRKQSATKKRTSLFTSEAHECIDRAGFLGRWLAAAGTPATIYSAWGITP